MDMFELKTAGIDTEYPYKKQYGNYIGGQWVPPVRSAYFDNGGGRLAPPATTSCGLVPGHRRPLGDKSHLQTSSKGPSE